MTTTAPPAAAEADRLAAVRRLALLDSPTDRFDHVVRLAQRLFDVPIAMINLVDAHRQQPVAAVGTDRRDLPRAEAFCPHTLAADAGWMVVEDTRADARFADNPLVVGGAQLRFYAGNALVSPSGARVGALCILDDKPRTMSAEDLALLHDLSRWLEGELIRDQDTRRTVTVQRALAQLPPSPFPDVSLAAAGSAAYEVSGDFHDVTVVDGRLQVAVADVMGKGTAAGMIGAGIRGALRASSPGMPLAETFRRVNRTAADDLERTSAFVTMFALRLGDGGRVDYTDAGHGLALLVSATGVRRLSAEGLPLGVDPGQEWQVRSADLAPGDAIVVVSDGLAGSVTELMALGPTVQRLLAAGAGPKAVVERLMELSSSAERLDDRTVVVLHRHPGGATTP